MKIDAYKKNGKTHYKFQIRLGKKVKSRAGFTTKPAAIFAYTQMLEDYQNEVEGNITYQKVFNEWLEIYKTRVKETTLQSTTTIFRIHILPVFGDMRIGDISTKDCQDFALSLTQFVKGKEYYFQAKRIMTYAMGIYKLPSNPFNLPIMPHFKEKDDEVNFLEPDEANKFLEYFNNDIYWKAMFRIFIYAGLRRGECLALTWKDIDFKRKGVDINKTLGTGKDNKLVVSTPKTKKSKAFLELDEETLLILKELKLQSKNDIIFPNSKGNYRRLSDPDRKLKKALKDLGLKPIRVHDLRHTHASLLFYFGWDIKAVQERLRHSSSKTTMDIYVHVAKKKPKQDINNFASKMDKFA
ncbi:site-specific integrase [Anaerococcus sp. NML200537]|uniref:site-specific integrase n=1 Tax=Anaerococcus sp. NML200537 TaxID=2954485 RepID=UPI002238D366|nr:site-specific integrase [Anaerococcus sp. NML200537]MCW6701459.1 site-specific integrase [Anaerococcus sp. NML200537]